MQAFGRSPYGVLVSPKKRGYVNRSSKQGDNIAQVGASAWLKRTTVATPVNARRRRPVGLGIYRGKSGGGTVQPSRTTTNLGRSEIGSIHLGTLWGLRSFSRQGQALRVAYGKP